MFRTLECLLVEAGFIEQYDWMTVSNLEQNRIVESPRNLDVHLKITVFDYEIGVEERTSLLSASATCGQLRENLSRFGGSGAATGCSAI